MKTERRHELETNQLADSLSHWVDGIRPYTSSILVVLVAGLIALGIYLEARRRTAAETAVAWQDYFAVLGSMDRQIPDRQKLEDLGEAHPGTPIGWWSLCLAGDVALSEGSHLLFRDTALAHDYLRSAAERYQQVLGATRDPALLQQASYGLARVHECLGDIKQAEGEYQTIASKWPDTPFAVAANKRVADLKRPEVRQFYDWFNKQDVGKKASPRSGMPDLRGPLDLKSLPDMPEASGATTGEDAAPNTGENPDAPGPSDAPEGSAPEGSAPEEKASGDSAPAETSGEKPAESK